MKYDKRIIDMNDQELYDVFKNEVVELFQQIFRGDQHHEVNLSLFLGAKTEKFAVWANENKDKIQFEFGERSKDENGNFNPNADTVSLIPVPIEMVMGPAHQIASGLPPFLADGIMQTAKQKAAEMVTSLKDHVNKQYPGTILFYAMVAESFVVEVKDNPDLYKKLSTGELKPRDVPGVKEKMTFVFECEERSDIVTFDIVRSTPDENTFQVLMNRDEQQCGSGKGVFEGLIYKGGPIDNGPTIETQVD